MMNASPNPVVVRVITWLPVGGIERRMVAVLPRLRDRGWSPRVVCIREEGPLAADLRDAGIPVDVLPVKSRLSPTGIRALSRYFTEHKAAIVHSHMYRSNVPGTMAARLAGIPAIFGQVHNVGTWATRRQRLVEAMVARLRNGTFAVSKAVQQDVMTRLRLPEEKVPLLYNGIDTDLFQPSPERGTRLREELGLPDDAVVFLVPARLHQQKNPDGTLQAAIDAMKGQDDPLPHFVLAGEGKLREGLERQAAESPHPGHFHFLGARDDMIDLYNAADVILLSSFKEGFSNAIVEGLSCGKPCLVSDVGGNREAVSSGKVGWVHASGDGEALLEQIIEATRRGRAGLSAMAGDCRAQALLFSIDRLVEQTSDFYARALGCAPKQTGSSLASE
ncbi:MAG: glycosyltransferase [Candidatus Sumerlaeia bacterium]|nr:glycosyltransferase [Candidatus Sumerlaeia bacterium]